MHRIFHLCRCTAKSSQSKCRVKLYTCYNFTRATYTMEFIESMYNFVVDPACPYTSNHELWVFLPSVQFVAVISRNSSLASSHQDPLAQEVIAVSYLLTSGRIPWTFISSRSLKMLPPHTYPSKYQIPIFHLLEKPQDIHRFRFRDSAVIRKV